MGRDRSRLADLQEDLARRLTDGDTAAKGARALARQAQENLQDLQGKVGALDAKLSESRASRSPSEAMYQEVLPQPGRPGASRAETMEGKNEVRTLKKWAQTYNLAIIRRVYR